MFGKDEKKESQFGNDHSFFAEVAEHTAAHAGGHIAGHAIGGPVGGMIGGTAAGALWPTSTGEVKMSSADIKSCDDVMKKATVDTKALQDGTLSKEEYDCRYGNKR